MKKTTYADKSAKDLHKILLEKRQALKDFYFGVAGSKVTDVKAGRNLRREIARLLTRLHVTEEQGKV